MIKDKTAPNLEIKKEISKATSKISTPMSELAPEESSESQPLVSRNILFPIKNYQTPMTKMANLLSPKISEQDENQ